jgi:hypothetical protein
MFEPVVDEICRQRCRRRALVLDDAECGLDQPDVALVEHQENALRAVAAVTALTLDTV